MSPATSNLYDGLVSPIPTLPLSNIVITFDFVSQFVLKSMSNLVLELVPEFSLLQILNKAPAGFDCAPVPFLPKYNVVFGSLIAVVEVCVGCKTINELLTKLFPLKGSL